MSGGGTPGEPGPLVAASRLDPVGEESLVSIVIVNWNARETILACLDAVAETRETLRESGLEIEVTVVDNASTDGSVEAIRDAAHPWRLIENRRNAGFGAANNQAFATCRGRWVLLLNPDTELNSPALEGLVAHLREHPDVGAAGLSLVDQDRRVMNSFDNFPSVLTELFSKHLLRFLFPGRFPSKRDGGHEPREVDVIIGACLLLRAELLWRLDGFDEDFFLFVEEADLCRRIRNVGYRIVHLPDLEIVHGRHPSKGKAPTFASLEAYRSTAHFLEKHGSRALARLFQWLRGLKLAGIGVPLSLLATAFTAGRVPRHVRRLRIRVRILAWYLLGCPDAWGMRLVSPFRGYRCVEEGERTGIVAEGSDATLERWLSSSEAAIEDPDSGAVLRHESGGREIWEIPRAIEAPPALREDLAAIDRLYLVRHVRPAGWLAVPPGIEEFERALEWRDRGGRGAVVLGCGAGDGRSFVLWGHAGEVDGGEVPGVIAVPRARCLPALRGARRWEGLPEHAAAEVGFATVGERQPGESS